MRRYKWMPGRSLYAMLVLVFVLIGNPPALAQQGENVAYPIENVLATSNANSEAEAGPENTVNGSGLNANDEHSTQAIDMWLGLLEGGPVHIQYEFDGVYELHEMWVWNFNVLFEGILGFGAKDVTIEYSENGTDWTTLGDVQFAQAPARPDYVANTIVPLNGISARSVRLTILSGWGMLGQAGLSEVRFWTLTEPDTVPADGHSISGVIAISNAISDEGQGPENTVNLSGLNPKDEHSTEHTAMWLGAPEGEPVYIQYAFDAVYELSEMWVWNYNVMFEGILGFGVKDVTIEYSENGTHWATWGDVQFAQASASPDYTANTIVPLDGVSARFIRLNINSGWGMLGQFGLSEVRFFTSEAPTLPSFALLLDDFESYNPIERRIYDIWLDGWINESGSTVGYLESPFTEQWIVNSGAQSMPLFYDNRVPPFYAEAHRDLEESLQDWTVNGAGALTLYFHGSLDKDHNVATDRLYVAVQDDQERIAVVRHPDPEALLADGWHEWSIGFEAFEDVDLSHVVRLAVGVGDRENSRSGGSSVVYIDDIGLSVVGAQADPISAIPGVVATSNAVSEEEEGPENVVNGSGLNDNYEHSTVYSDMWVGELGDDPAYIQFAFERVYELDEMWVWNYNSHFELLLNFGVKDVSIAYSEDGASWTTWGDVRFAQGPATDDYTVGTIVEFGGISAQYVRLTIQSGWGVLGRVGLSEVKFFGD